jgi:hypothetical protein
MSALIDPVVNLDFYQISSRGSRLSVGAQEFSGVLDDVHCQLGRHFDHLVAPS